MDIYNLDFLVSIKACRRSYEKKLSDSSSQEYYIKNGYIVEDLRVYEKPRVILIFSTGEKCSIIFDTYEDACDCAKKLSQKIKNKIEI